MDDDFPLDTEAFLRVLNHLNDAVYITDPNRRIVLWNKKAEEITGYEASEVVGTACGDNILNHVDKNGKPLCVSGRCPLFRAMTTGSASLEPILIYAKSKSGRHIPVSVSVAPLRDARGNVVGGIEAFRDETTRMHDLEFARRIQQHILPSTMPENQQVSFDVRYYPRDLVGGDFYQVEDMGGGDFSIFVADVRGHGISAALYTMQLKLLASTFPTAKNEPAWHMGWLNQRLCELTIEESFATAFYGVIESQALKLTYANAAHPPPLLLDCRARTVTELSFGGLLLGVDANEHYQEFSVRLTPPCWLLCYTDGATEIESGRGEELGREGLKQMLTALDFSSRTPVLDQLYEKLLTFAASVTLSDDVLLLSCLLRRT